jgi:hypothetical protein
VVSFGAEASIVETTEAAGKGGPSVASLEAWMKILPMAECAKWLGSHGTTLDESDYPIVQGMKYAIEVPISADTATGLVYAICEIEREDFEGGVVVFREWNLGSPELDRVGQTSVALMLGNNVKLDPKGPLCIQFDATEWLPLQAFTLQSLIFHWDAFYVPSSASFMVFVSHDEVVYFVTGNSTIDEQLIERLERWPAKRVKLPEFLAAD